MKIPVWPILPSCPAQNHNTVKAANGGYPDKVRCVCLHALDLLTARRVKKRERYHLTKSVDIANPDRKGRPLKEHSVMLAVRTHTVPPMDFPRGACSTPQGLMIMDEYQAAPHTRHTIDAARKLCRGCASLAACADWVRRAERPAGAWQGMIGGMSRIERYDRNGEHEDKS